MDYDELLHYIGNFGLYQILAFILISYFVSFAPAWMTLSLTFVFGTPEHWCKVNISLLYMFIHSIDRFLYCKDQCVFCRTELSNTWFAKKIMAFDMFQIDRLQNFSHAQQKYISIPQDSSGNYESCRFFNISYNDLTDSELENWDRDSLNGTGTVACDQWVYDQSQYVSTSTMEVLEDLNCTFCTLAATLRE